MENRAAEWATGEMAAIDPEIARRSKLEQRPLPLPGGDASEHTHACSGGESQEE